MYFIGFVPAHWKRGTCERLRAVGPGKRMDREGHPHDGSAIVWEGRDTLFVDTKKYTGKRMMAYGQMLSPRTSMQPGMRPVGRSSTKPAASSCTT